MRLKYALLTATFLSFAAPAFADEYVMLKVNNQDVSSSEVQHMWEGLFPPGQAPSMESMKPDVRERILRAVMAEKLIYSEAIKQGADKTPKLVAELEDVKKKLVVRSFLDSKTSDMITEADLKREYDAFAANVKDEKEVRARHILVASEQEAKDVKKKLESGKSFEEVARDFSKDPGSAKNGGDLGYFTKDKMVKEFASAAFAMKKGEISGPVKSEFGYHIIKVEDMRKAAAPSFAEMKDQLKAKLQEKKLNDYVGGLVKSADVKAFDNKGKEISFSKDLPTQPANAGPTKAAAEAKPAKEEKKADDKKAEEKSDEKKSEKSDKAEKSEKAD